MTPFYASWSPHARRAVTLIDTFFLSRDANQARGLAQYAIEFCGGLTGAPDDSVLRRVAKFHRDSVACAYSAIQWKTTAPTVLRAEALDYPCNSPWGVPCYGSDLRVHPEKAVVANSSAAREWDANGTNFGYCPDRQATRGEFGHNDFYPVVLAGVQIAAAQAACPSVESPSARSPSARSPSARSPSASTERLFLRAMLCLDEIRGRLAEVFALKDHKIDHVLHGAIASAAVFGALVGASVDQLESAIGMVVAHYVPFRAIRAGHQLSDSKGASAAMSTELAILSVRRAMRGFRGPADIFRNPQAVFCLFEPPARPDCSPFDLALGLHGEDFAIMGMHFKLGLYEHQSAGAIQGVIDLLSRYPEIIETPARLTKLRIRIYEPAFSIIGDPAKRNPQTRQSADHSMVYIVATLIRKAIEQKQTGWQDLMLLPIDYQQDAIQHRLTRQIMELIEFSHGGDEFDRRYPDGIPTEVELVVGGRSETECYTSGLVMYPTGHARCEQSPDQLLEHKFQQLTGGALDTPEQFDAYLGLSPAAQT